MQTQDKNSIDSQENRLPPEPRRPRKWLAGLGAFVVVLLVIGVSIFVFAGIIMMLFVIKRWSIIKSI